MSQIQVRRLLVEIPQLARKEGSSEQPIVDLVALLETIPAKHHPAVFAIVRKFGSMSSSCMNRVIELTTADS